MALTQAERERLVGKWRGLAELALDCARPGDPPAPFERLKTEAHEALNWATPLIGYQDAFVLFSLARFAAAFAKSSHAVAARRSPVMVGLAELSLEMLGPQTDAVEGAPAWWADH